MRTILVIDDATEIAELVQECMPTYRVRNASDGIIGLDLLQEHHEEIDLVLLDVNMPRLDGKAALLRIRSLFPTIPVRIFSAFVTDMVQQLAVELTGKVPIIKPIKADRLKIELSESIAQQAASIQPSGVLQYAHNLATDLEVRGRAEPPLTRILVCGANRIILYGLRRLIESTEIPFVYVQTSVDYINHFSQDQGSLIVATTYADFKQTLLSPFPIICITVNFIDALNAIQQVNDVQLKSKQSKIVAIVVDDPDHPIEIAKHIRDGIQKLMRGQSYTPYQLANPFLDPLAERPLSPDEREVIRCELLNKDTKTIASLLKSTPEAIRQVRFRLVKKLGVPAEQWPAWAEQWWRSHYP